MNLIINSPYFFASTALIFIGVTSIFVNTSLIKKVIGINICGQGIFLFFVVISNKTVSPNSLFIADPVPQAMVLTGIVVAFSATAFALYLIRRIFDKTGQEVLPEDLERISEKGH